jgi:DNA topoisomerase I
MPMKAAANKIGEVIDLEQFPEMAELIYVSDGQPGIVRVRDGDGFKYLAGDKEITDEKQLERIRKLVIPPAWESVWICKRPNGHIQCTGLDTKGRKQYRYHPLWQQSRNQSKFGKLLAFGKALTKLRARMKQDIAKRKLCEEKVIATVLYLMQSTHIRIGNSQYEKLNKSYGLTTLKDKHVDISGSRLQFEFVGKKGIRRKVSIQSRQLARIVKQCRDIPGKELFQYYDEKGERRSIDSGKVNAYIRKHMNGDFTAKDLRTWFGTINSIHAFSELGEAENATLRKKKIVEALDMVSEQLGNTRTVCKKYYVHPLIIQLYEEGELKNYLKSLRKDDDPTAGLTSEEKILMKILKKAA